MAARASHVRRLLNGNLRRNFGARSVSGCLCTSRLPIPERHWMLRETEAVSGWLALRSLTSAARTSTLEGAGGSPMAAYQRLCTVGRLKPGDPPQRRMEDFTALYFTTLVFFCIILMTTMMPLYKHDEAQCDEDNGTLLAAARNDEKVVAALDKLFQDLSRHREPRGLPEWLSGVFWKPKRNENSLKGVYIYGGVGRGKTMLMDLFYDKVNLSKKRRVHFHAFMLDIHGRLHKLLMERSDNSALDSIKVVAEQLNQEASLLCLDEVEVTDVADALILRRLFAVLWPLGMVVVATSNACPDQLYRGGLNRPLFEPFIKQLKEHCYVYSLDEGQSLDYRRGLSRLDQLYLYPPLGSNDELLHEVFMTLTGGASGSMTEIQLMMGRHLQILAANRVARTSFSVLCGGPHGAADYMAIAHSFQSLFLERIPWLGDPEVENEARRFITLIDVLYEANILFVCSAAVSIDELFLQKPDISKKSLEELQQVQKELGLSVVGEGGSSGRSTLMIGAMEWSATGRMGVSLAKLQGSTSFTRAASARTVSRLLEMQSPGYLSRTGTFGGIILSKQTVQTEISRNHN